MRKIFFLLVAVSFVASLFTAYVLASEADSVVKFGVGAGYFSQEVDDFSRKKAVTIEYTGGNISGQSEGDYRNAETEVDGWFFSPEVALWNKFGFYGLLGVIDVDYEFDDYVAGVNTGKVGVDGDSGFAWGFGIDANVLDRNAWELVVGVQFLTQKADGTPWAINPAGNKLTFAEDEVDQGATSASTDYDTKFNEWSVTTTLSKKVELNKAMLSSVKPYAGVEWFRQELKTDGSLTVQGGTGGYDSFTDEWEFKQDGWNATTGFQVGLWENVSIDFYGKWPNKQELGGKVTIVF